MSLKHSSSPLSMKIDGQLFGEISDTTLRLASLVKRLDVTKNQISTVFIERPNHTVLKITLCRRNFGHNKKIGVHCHFVNKKFMVL